MMEIKNLKKRYDRVLFEKLNIKFPTNGLVFIEGENGCGKTTLFRLILGMEKSDEGTIIYKNIQLKIKEDFEEVRKDKIACVLQDFCLVDHYTIEQNLMLPLLASSLDNHKARIRDVLNQVGIQLDLKTSCINLSGGEKQKVAIARALIMDKPIILCDEPTSSLDQESANKVFELLKKLSSNRLIICISHDEIKAREYANYIFSFSTKKLIKVNKNIQENSKVRTHQHRPIRLNKILDLSNASLKHRKWRSILSIIAFSFVLLFFFFTLSLSQSIETNLTSALINYPNFNMLEVTKTSTLEISGSSLSFVKEKRPEREALMRLLSHEDYQITYNYSSFFERGNFYNEKEKVAKTILFMPLYHIENTKYATLKSKVEKLQHDEVFYNEEANKILSSKSKLKIKTTIETISDSFTRVEDYLVLDLDLVKVDIIDEFSFMQVPIVYYSLEAMEDFFQSVTLEKASSLFKKEVTLYQRLTTLSSSDEQLSSYSYLIWSNQDNLYDLEKILKYGGYDVTSYPLQIGDSVTNILEISKVVLIVFTLVSGVIAILLNGMIIYSMILDRKKEIGIFFLHGFNHRQINILLEMDAFLLSYYGFLICLIIYPFLQKIVNTLIFNLLNIPNFLSFKTTFIFPFDVLILIGLAIVFIGLTISNIIFKIVQKRRLIDLIRS